jgi:D-alanyl-lipoteichoic acid acyltransferase DltB (MBOAT superfamily)
MGLVRKVIIADTLHAAITPSAFIRPAEYPAPELLAWLFIYAFALYNDFAGYTSIARGISGMLGIELSPNFNLPYFSLSFNQFWNRWHMSLSFWLRDYIFFPLRRWLLRKKPGQEGWLSLAIPPMATMLVSSLWHGSGWSILLWGGLHGIYLIGEQLVRSRQVQAPAKQPAWKQALSMGTVFLLVSLAWAPFRMDVGTTLEYWGALFELSTYRLVFEYPRMFLRIFIILLFMLPVVGLDWLQLRCQDEAFALRWPLVVQSLSLALVFFLLFILVDSSGAVPFVYEGF